MNITWNNMKYLKTFETFEPRNTDNRDDDAKKKGIKLLNYFELAKAGKLKELDWDELEYDYINDENSDPTDTRRVILSSEGDLPEIQHFYTDTMLLVTFMKQIFEKGKFYGLSIKNGAYILQIEDDYDNIRREQFHTFEEGFKKMQEYFDQNISVYTGVDVVDENF